MSEGPRRKNGADDDRSNTWLNECALRVTSQYGEDGIIAKALEVIAKTDKWCVEFGSWDGKNCSNTYARRRVGIRRTQTRPNHNRIRSRNGHSRFCWPKIVRSTAKWRSVCWSCVGTKCRLPRTERKPYRCAANTRMTWS